MNYNYKLLSAEVVGAYNKIIIDARLDDGQVVAAFCGAPDIAGMCSPGTRLWLKRTSRTKRLVKYNRNITMALYYFTDLTILIFTLKVSKSNSLTPSPESVSTISKVLASTWRDM